MTVFRRAGSLLAVCATAALAASALDARGEAAIASAPARLGVELVMPPGGDTLNDITPTLTVQAVAIVPAERPIVLGLQVATTAGFVEPVLLDTTVVGDTVPITLTRPLPEGATLFFRAGARPSVGGMVFSQTFRRSIAPWLRLVSPNDVNGTTLDTPRPRFVWTSVDVTRPPGPFRYELQIRNVGSGRTIVYSNLADTNFVLPLPLEINTSYRWLVTARLLTGESASATSEGSFVIVDPAIPLATLLYQNFPNPFPTATASSTCVWFDLNRAAAVNLDVYDLQGRHVRTIIPGEGGPLLFAAGRHGRDAGRGGAGACNGTIRWDGRGRDGRFVPAGVYLLRLRADGAESVKKIVFRGNR